MNRLPTSLRILQVYNRYRRYGGEDRVADLEAELLRKHGHEVERVTACTGELEDARAWRLLRAGFGTVWSGKGYSTLREAIRTFSPDIVHVHNTFPLLSPSVYWAAAKAGVPVVQTLHNFRFTCANSLLLRQDKPCQACVGRFPWPALRYRCHSRSLGRTAAVVAMNVIHGWLGTFRTKVQAYIALNEFSKGIFARSGLPEERIFVKSNFTATRPRHPEQRLPQVIFVGGISRHKGLHLLLEAWRDIRPTGYRLLVIGEGPERVALQREHAADASVVWCGSLPHEKVLDHLASSKLLALPSLCYENLPVAVLEALSLGTPVVVPDHGAFPSLISHLEDGLLFTAGDASSLAESLRIGLRLTDAEWVQCSEHAHNKYLDKYTDAGNYVQLMSIYEHATEHFGSKQEERDQSRRSRGVSTVIRDERLKGQ
jgi:glycosyltransferase involved in cell wall biosynthesis